MNKIKINSELPLCMLKYNTELNEYDFVLYHLYISNETYREYYRNLRKSHPDRLMILDNSAYEFFVKGETLDLIKFRDCIIDLKPDVYILPDTLMNKAETVRKTVEFLKIIAGYNISSVPMAVAQGVTADELRMCLDEYYHLGISCVAIPFHNSFFKEMGAECEESIRTAFESRYKHGLNEDLLYAMGRVSWVDENRDMLDKFNHVHFLGSHCPYEKVYYKDYHTMDTGYPVKLGYEGEILFYEKEKPKIIIDDFLTEQLDFEIVEAISINIDLFKNL